MSPLAIVAARSRNGVIGNGGTIPWSVKEDLQTYSITVRPRTLGSIGAVRGRK